MQQLHLNFLAAGLFFDPGATNLGGTYSGDLFQDGKMRAAVEVFAVMLGVDHAYHFVIIKNRHRDL